MTINHFLDKISFAMHQTFQKKCEDLKKKLEPLAQEERIKFFIELGRALPPFKEEWKTSDRIVKGCQSILYLQATFQDGKVFFEAHADALVSAGLAALLIHVYSGETPEVILTCPPKFIEELGLASILSLNRSNGLAHILLKMKQEALKHLVYTSSS